MLHFFWDTLYMYIYTYVYIYTHTFSPACDETAVLMKIPRVVMMIGCNACPAFGFAKGEPAGGAGFFQTLFFQNVLFLTVFFFLNCIFSNCICPTCIFPNCFFLLQTIFSKLYFFSKLYLALLKVKQLVLGATAISEIFPRSRHFDFYPNKTYFFILIFRGH